MHEENTWANVIGSNWGGSGLPFMAEQFTDEAFALAHPSTSPPVVTPFRRFTSAIQAFYTSIPTQHAYSSGFAVESIIPGTSSGSMASGSFNAGTGGAV